MDDESKVAPPLSPRVPCVNRMSRAQKRDAPPIPVIIPRKTAFAHRETCYVIDMASERMMQAIGTLERAISRLEQESADFVAAVAPVPSHDHAIDMPSARAALRSLDDLIDELKGKADG